MARPMNGRSQRRGPAVRQEKREAAEAMVAEWRKLSVAEQIASLLRRRGNSKRQLARLRGLDG